MDALDSSLLDKLICEQCSLMKVVFDYASNTLTSVFVENTAHSDNFSNLSNKGTARKVSSSSGILIIGKSYLLTPSQSKEIKVKNFQKFMRGVETRGNNIKEYCSKYIEQQHKVTAMPNMTLLCFIY